MTSEIERAALYLRDMEQSMKKISVFIEGMTLENFKNDEKTQDAVHMRLLVIGEAVTNIQQKCGELLERHPEIPWKAIRGMRNKIAHEYFSIMPERTWAAAKEDLPVLQAALEKIKRSEPELMECLQNINQGVKASSPVAPEKSASEKPKRHRMR